MRILTMLLLSLLSLAMSASASDFPAGPVKLVHGLPGGMVDTGARVLGELLSAAWKQPVIVDGKPGANEMIAADAVARASKDGLTLLIASESPLVNIGLLTRKPLVDAPRDLVPVCELFEVPFGLIVRSDLGANTVEEFVALAKGSGRPRVYASAGVGSAMHLAMEGFTQSVGIQLMHVPYKTIAQMTQDMLGGAIDAAFFGVPSALPFVKAGKLKILAVTGAVRSAASPQTPSFAELGYRNVDYRSSIVLLAPRGTPAQTLARIEADVRAAVHSSDYARRFLDIQDLKPGAADGRGMAELLAARRISTQRLIQALDIKLD